MRCAARPVAHLNIYATQHCSQQLASFSIVTNYWRSGTVIARRDRIRRPARLQIDLLTVSIAQSIVEENNREAQ
jgi:hypothetical protein